MTSESSLDCDKNLSRFKCLILGDYGVGKTAFCETLCASHEALRVRGAILHPLVLATSGGPISLMLCEPAGQERYGELEDDFFRGADCAIHMFSVESRRSYDRLYGDKKRLSDLCGNVPSVLVANFCDVAKPKIRKVMIQFHLHYNIPMFEVSTKENLDCHVPLLWLCKVLRHDPCLTFTVPPAAAPRIPNTEDIPPLEDADALMVGFTQDEDFDRVVFKQEVFDRFPTGLARISSGTLISNEMVRTSKLNATRPSLARW